MEKVRIKMKSRTDLIMLALLCLANTIKAQKLTMKNAGKSIAIRTAVAIILMLASVWNLMSYLKEIFLNAWQGNFNTSVPSVMWLWVVLGIVGVVIFIRVGMSWDRIQDAEATNLRR